MASGLSLPYLRSSSSHCLPDASLARTYARWVRYIYLACRESDGWGPVEPNTNSWGFGLHCGANMGVPPRHPPTHSLAQGHTDAYIARESHVGTNLLERWLHRPDVDSRLSRVRQKSARASG